MGTVWQFFDSIFLCLSRHRYDFLGDIFLDEQIDRVRLSLDHLLRANPYVLTVQLLEAFLYKDLVSKLSTHDQHDPYPLMDGF